MDRYSQVKNMKQKSRLTIDMSPSEHVYLKTACAKLGITMRELLLRSAFEKIEDMEDEWLARRAKETLNNIKSGKEKLISWDELKKRMQ